jgi:ADP-dependent NAD(P)H-hydrate dehydratase / NAD(P)H-hydrate epimerase
MDFRTVLTKGEMRHADRMTIETDRITGFDLMHRAGTAMFQVMTDHNLIDRKHDILVLAGSGNNGGDALVIASCLVDEGYSVRIYTIGNTSHRSTEMNDALKRVTDKDTGQNQLDETTFESFKNELERVDCLIDGMFGTGFDQKLDAFRQSVIEAINEAKLNVISIDLPSGINARNGLCKTAIKANTTLIIQNEKPGNLLGDAPDYHGKRMIIDIGVRVPNDLHIKRQLLSQETMTFERRRHNTHKYDFGHCLVVGGSTEMMGAPLLAAQAAMRTGAGLVTVAYDYSCFPDRLNIVPEIMSASFADYEQFCQHLQKKDAIVFGMGLGKSAWSFDPIQPMIDQCKPVVIDADGLTHLKRTIERYDRLEHVLITPHLKEFADLVDHSLDEIKNDPLKYAETFAEKTGITVLLKGPCTIVTDGKTTYFSEFGNPGLATAGSGDVLSGIIGSLMAQGCHLLDASIKGLFLHGRAGDLACKRHGERSMIARDIINELSVVIKHQNVTR